MTQAAHVNQMLSEYKEALIRAGESCQAWMDFIRDLSPLTVRLSSFEFSDFPDSPSHSRISSHPPLISHHPSTTFFFKGTGKGTGKYRGVGGEHETPVLEAR